MEDEESVQSESKAWRSLRFLASLRETLTFKFDVSRKDAKVRKDAKRLLDESYVDD